ncbi:MAG: anthranilate phosphoribosyltransferase [Archaeoglobaceae archaeon]|nr:anthranilate phosphoribosyltransferase [Archaeoglobaceae archaeon]MCX8152672.1 anthranilate phosphoribosyltransferase [Archaeoglobaceae archaeon]MDW8013673.1 anthranilate phosphoribosyltransferase [Archaeoglobaceae archaeon]
MLRSIVERRLSFEEAYELFDYFLKESDIKVAACLAALQARNVSSEELAGFAKAMRDNCIKIDLGEVCDTCGTGGDNASTINVSTAAAIVLSCFKKVAKHGNRSVTSRSGSADVLESLGIRIVEKDKLKDMIERTNFAFLFAPKFHPLLQKFSNLRKELGIRTIFNLAAPLANPSEPKYQLIGVSDPRLVEVVAEAAEMLKIKRAIVVCGIKVDEVNPSGETIVAEVENGIDFYKVYPKDFGFDSCKIIPCSDARESATRIEAVFRGKGLKEDEIFININSAMALFASGFSFKESLELVKVADVEKKLEVLRCVSSSLIQ